jgi:hypothetical protein
MNETFDVVVSGGGLYSRHTSVTLAWHRDMSPLDIAR